MTFPILTIFPAHSRILDPADCKQGGQFRLLIFKLKTAILQNFGNCKKRVILLGFFFFCSPTGYASEVEIRVTNTQGVPVIDAATCLGTHANPSQFGVYLTRDDGTASFNDVPSTDLLLTVSKVGHLGYAAEYYAGDYDRIISVALKHGGLGPVCDTASLDQGGISATSSPQVQRLQINDGDSATPSRSVQLLAVVSGSPTHFRASEQPKLEDAEWKPFKPSSQFKLSVPKGQKTIYYQVRRYHELNGSNMESASDIVSSMIVLD